MNKMPERINAIKLISYNTEDLINMLSDENDIPAEKITLEMVMDRIKDWVEEDFAHDVSDETIFQDENGKDIS